MEQKQAEKVKRHTLAHDSTGVCCAHPSLFASAQLQAGLAYPTNLKKRMRV